MPNFLQEYLIYKGVSNIVKSPMSAWQVCHHDAIAR